MNRAECSRRLIRAGAVRLDQRRTAPAGFPAGLARDLYERLDVSSLVFRIGRERRIRFFVEPPYRDEIDGRERWVIGQSNEEDRVLLVEPVDPSCRLEYYDLGADVLYRERGARLERFLESAKLERYRSPLVDLLARFRVQLLRSDGSIDHLSIDDVLRELAAQGVPSRKEGGRFILGLRDGEASVAVSDADAKLAIDFASEQEMTAFVAALPASLVWCRI